jgi:glycosyltransferase involved in cell wall biosynthesis
LRSTTSRASSSSRTRWNRRRSADAIRVLVLTTSYPRDEDDISGAFIAATVAELQTRGLGVQVVSPADFRHHGLARPPGIPANVLHRPWLALLVPSLLVSFRQAAARAAHEADLVHAHWLGAGAVAATLGKPYVLQVHGTDLVLARRFPWLARPILRRAAVVVAGSRALEADARALGARDVRVIPTGVPIPPEVVPPDEPPHILFVGRLSEEKGVLELAEAARDLPLVVAGSGHLASRIRGVVGPVPPRELGGYYDRAAVVAVPSRREGYGLVAREAMAHGRPVVASAVGGLVEAIEDGVNGVLVPVRDVGALRRALEELLADADRRARLGAVARTYAVEHFSCEAEADALVTVYDEVAARCS